MGVRNHVEFPASILNVKLVMLELECPPCDPFVGVIEFRIEFNHFNGGH